MKNKIRLVLILAFLAFVSFYYGAAIKANALSANDSIINVYYSIRDLIVDGVSKHFNQAEQIENLRAKNRSLEEANALIATFSNQLNQVLEDKNSTQYLPRVSLVRAISYVQISNYEQVWLSSASSVAGKNKGLIYEGYTAGIAVNKNGRILGILQGDEQCVFSVYIGKQKASGVLQGKNGKTFVRYIPKHQNINVGDEVFTSGLDEIFFAGVPVGKVVKIIEDNMYQSAEIQSFVSVNTPSYMYMVENF